MHRFVDGLCAHPVHECVFIPDGISRGDEGIIVEVADVAEDGRACLAHRPYVPRHDMVELDASGQQNVGDGNAVLLPVGRKVLDGSDAARCTRVPPDQAAMQVAGVADEALVAALLEEGGRLHRVPEFDLKVPHACHQVVVPEGGLERGGEGTLRGVSVAHALLPRLAHVRRDQGLPCVGVGVAHVVGVAQAALHVAAVLLLQQVDLRRVSHQVELDVAHDGLVREVRLFDAELPAHHIHRDAQRDDARVGRQGPVANAHSLRDLVPHGAVQQRAQHPAP